MARSWLLPVIVVALTAPGAGSDDGPVPYPEGYRRWAHVKTLLVSAENPRAARFAGMHHIYANNLALEGYETGRFPDGAVIVFDLLDVKTDKGNTEEGARKFIDVMLKDARRFAATGGWGYEEFAGATRGPTLDAARAAACSACHERMAPTDHVISTLRE
jgi:hypothetical protein